jgi:NAD+ synthase (glutamine-hydrolysing)
MLIALNQMNSFIGDLEGNKKKILEGYQRGIEAGADIVICPELSLVGYPPLDLIEKEEFRKAVYNITAEIASETKSTGLIFGSIWKDNDRIGTDIHNSAIFCFDGEIKFVQHKSLIPNYDVFDEMRYFEAAKCVEIFEYKGVKLGISICEDIWNDSEYWNVRRYHTDPVKDLINKGAEVLINISASPYVHGKREDRREMLSHIARNSGLPLAYVCCVGAQTEIIFDGASMCFNSKGELVVMGKRYDEELLLFNTGNGETKIESVESGFEEEVLEALIFGLKEYCTKTGFKKAVIGLSGGIDSALVAYMAVKALGNDNVHVIMMPSQYSSEGSIKDSQKLIRNLGITGCSQLSIQAVYDEILSKFSELFKGTETDITEQNIQARIRGIYLMAYSNKFNHLLLTTGNKSEVAVGYATLYGDMAGGLAIIADVYKTDVYRICNYINRNEEIIPVEIINKAPSAELKPDQKDQDSLPEYDLLDKILKLYLEENKEENEITELIGDQALVTKVLRLVDFNEFKRRQAAPALKISKKSFGYGRRYPVVQGWRK